MLMLCFFLALLQVPASYRETVVYSGTRLPPNVIASHCPSRYHIHIHLL